MDLTQGRGGPYCTLLLAAFGAQVIKVEPPGSGDVTRREGPFLKDEPHRERSAPFLYLNRNKLSVTLDVNSESGQALLQRLARISHVVVESFAPGALSSLALGYDVLQRDNPALVLTSVTDFGQTGPYRDYRGSEMILDALAGWAYVTGYPDREPLRSGLFQAQYAAGLNAAIHTVAALNVALLTGQGRHVDVSALETAAHWVGSAVAMYTHGDGDRVRAGNWTGMVRGAAGPRSHPTEIYACMDGYVGVAVQSPQQWEMFSLLLDLPELRDDPRFSTDYASRGQHARELNEVVAPWFKARTREEIFRLCGEYRVPAGMVYDVSEILQDPQHEAAGFFTWIAHPDVGELPYPLSPIRGEGVQWDMEPAPRLGQHNKEVYCGLLGCAESELLLLHTMGVV
ncbi:MAG: CoA transferase [Chloroflexi bacterium]|nr:CoA transferase [Chloroflexota bacterium]